MPDRAAQENFAPNGMELGVDHSKKVRRVKGAAGSSSKAVAKKLAAVAAKPAATEGESSHRPISPAQARPAKQQKIGDGERALVNRSSALSAESNWTVSPPMPRVQQRHIAFALKAKSTRVRGPSALHPASELATGSDAREVEVLIRGVEGVELLENEG